MGEFGSESETPLVSPKFHSDTVETLVLSSLLHKVYILQQVTMPVKYLDVKTLQRLTMR